MDDETPTAWEEINPPMVSAKQPGLPATYSDLTSATSEEFAAELTACLALVVPVGMTEEGRREWLSVAWKTLGHLPPDLLSRGAEVARKKCDHPSKIVPTIIAETEESMQWRLSHRPGPTTPMIEGPPPKRRNLLDLRGERMTQEETDELNEMLEKLGGAARYKPDGSRYFLDFSAIYEDK